MSSLKNNPEDRFVQVIILGQKWKAYLFTNREYAYFTVNNPTIDGSEACCLLDSKEMYFSVDGLKKSTIRHEIAHAYIDITLGVSKLPGAEYVCELLGNHGADIVDISDLIFKGLRSFVEKK